MDEDNICDIYENIAGWFDQNRQKTRIERFYLETLLANVKPCPLLLDLGCGSGEPIARFLIENGCKLTGVDSSAAMIAMCKKRFPAMEWIQADMRNLCLSQQFDALIAWDSFFHLGQSAQRSMFPIFASHLTHQGLLLFTSGSENGEVYGTMNGHRVYHASLDSAAYRALLEAHGFEVLIHRVNDPACGGRTVWLSKLSF